MSSSWTTLHGWRGWRKVSRKLREGEVMSCSKSERMRRCGRESRPYILDSTEGGHGPGDFETFLGDASVLLQRNVLHQPVVLPAANPEHQVTATVTDLRTAAAEARFAEWLQRERLGRS